MERVDQLKQELINAGLSGLALDIDETLSLTVMRWVQLLQAEFGNPEQLTFQQVRDRYLYTANVPYWQSPEALAFHEHLRGDDVIHESMPVIEGAIQGARDLTSIIPIVLYPTVRPVSVVRGTEKWLKASGFPDAPVFARPHGIPHSQGNAWKAGVLRSLYPYVQGIVDDNPGLVDHLSPDYPGVVFVYNNTDHPKRSDRVIPCPTWDDVVSNARNYFSSR